MYQAYVTNIRNLRAHPNADRLDLGECFGNTVCVGRGDFAEGDLVVYFPTDGQLSEAFCGQHNLVRRKDDAGNNIGGFIDAEKRNISAIRLRGNKSDGLVLPLSSLSSFGDITSLKEGDIVTVFNGHVIAEKYIPRRNVRQGHVSNGNKTRKHKVPVAPLFTEHADIEQLAYNLGAFKAGDEIEITLKMHGTSQRTGYLPVLKGYRRSILDRILRREGTPIYDYGYVSGTRRTVLEDYEGGYYGSNAFREQHSKAFEGKLWKGETVYYEVVGFTNSGTPIMGQAANKKMNDKDFIKQYGETTTFSYGCEPTGEKVWYGRDERGAYALPTKVPQSAMYVYRMTMTNEDGQVVEYTPDFMRYRCEQMGVNTVPVFAKAAIDIEGVYVYTPDSELYGFIHESESVGDTVKEVAEKYYDGPDPVGKTHIREGVVVRIVNRPKFCAYKHKNFAFKVLEGICKADAEAPDMEEAQE